MPAPDPSDPRSEYERMIAGDWYRYRLAPALAEATTSTQATCRQITALYDTDRPAAEALFREMLGSVGEDVDFRPPLYLDYGSRLHVGDGWFLNADLLVLGGGLVTIGKHVLIGPSVRIYTPQHALDVNDRRAGWKRVEPVTIEEDVWLGGNVVVVGNPARVVRTLA